VATVLITAATDSLFSRDGLLVLLGGAAGALAILGLLLLLPLYLTQRHEVERLLGWMDREPEAGTTEFRAIQPGAPSPPRAGGRMTPAERVTSERPALARITTQERDALALADAPLWRRVVDRGPRHPLVIAVIALLVAVAVVVAAGLLIRSGDGDGGKGGGVDPATVQVVVVNAGDSSGLADTVGDKLGRKGFDVTGNSVASKPASKSEVQYADGQRAAARAVARSLGLPTPGPFDPEAEAAADGADVVVIAADDLKSSDGGKD
jgi:hypothetical protein